MLGNRRFGGIIGFHSWFPITEAKPSKNREELSAWVSAQLTAPALHWHSSDFPSAVSCALQNWEMGKAASKLS